MGPKVSSTVVEHKQNSYLQRKEEVNWLWSEY